MAVHWSAAQCVCHAPFSASMQEHSNSLRKVADAGYHLQGKECVQAQRTVVGLPIWGCQLLGAAMQ